MYLAIVALHVVLCLFLVLIIILQPGKGDIGSAFGGGGSSSVFGPRGPTSLLSQATTVVAVLFMVTSITLAWFSNREIMAGPGGMSVEDILQDRQKRKQAPEAPEATDPGSAEGVNDAPGAGVDELPTEGSDPE